MSISLAPRWLVGACALTLHATPLLAQSEEVIRFDSGGRDSSRAVTLDANGAILVGGGVEDPDAPTMFAVVKHGANGSFQWRANLAAGPGDFANGWAIDLDADSAGNIFAAGTLLRSVANFQTAWDAAVASFTPAGVQRWVDVVPGSPSAQARATLVDVGADGAIIASAFVNNGWLTTKYSASGSILWRRSLAEGTGAAVVDQAPTNQGGVVVLGYTIQPGGALLQDLTVVKYDANGSVLWRRDFMDAPSSNDQPGAVVIDPAGAIYVTGLTAAVSAEDAQRPFLLRYSSAGALELSFKADEAGGQSVAIAPDGAVVTAGSAQDAAGTNIRSSVSKLAATGAIIWTRSIAAAGAPVIGDVGVAANGDVLFGGESEVKFYAAAFSANGERLLDRLVPNTHQAHDTHIADNGAILITGAESISTPNPDFFTVRIKAGAAPPPPPSAPAAPTNLLASGGRSSISLNWRDNAGNESGFLLQRAANGGAFATLAQFGANVTAATDRNVTSGVLYSYRVRAFNAAGNSAFSNTASAKISGKGRR